MKEMRDEPHVAAVNAHDGIRLLTASPSAKAVTEPVAAYVESQAEIVLWPTDAHRVRALLEVGETEEAIELYFARLGERWGREHLHREGIDSGRSTGIGSSWRQA